MTKQSAPIKATGGGGYTFADKVGAGFLAQMLKRKFPLEPELGVIAELHFETRDIGHVLDDLMLVLKRGLDVTNCFVSVKSNRQLTKEGFNKEFVQDAWNEWKGESGSGFDQSKDILGLKRGLDVTNCFVSVKSNRQLTKEGFNKEFVQDAWNEWKGESGSGFDQSKDILGLIVGQIDEPTIQEWQTLRKEASSTTPERLTARLQSDSKSSNKIQRAIFEGLRQSGEGEMDPVEYQDHAIMCLGSFVSMAGCARTAR